MVFGISFGLVQWGDVQSGSSFFRCDNDIVMFKKRFNRHMLKSFIGEYVWDLIQNNQREYRLDQTHHELMT